MARRIADLPAIDGLPAEARRVLNDRLQRIEQLTDAVAKQAGTSVEQVNALIAAAVQRVKQDTTAAVTKTPATDAASATGQAVLSIPGTLAIESNAAPLLSFKEARKVTEVELLLKQAPLGSTLDVRVLVDGAAMSTVTLLAGQTSVKSAASFSIAAGKLVRIDVLNVGTTFPGADLSVILRY